MTRQRPQESISSEQLMLTLQQAECIVPKQEVMRAYDELAAKVNAHYAGRNPVILVAMNGGLIPAGQLMTRFSFFHRMEYIHASRYQNNEATSELHWFVKPPANLEGEHILIIDDIFDQGVTLKSIVDELAAHNPASVKTCVLLNKEHLNKVSGFKVDFIGLTIPNRYVFGCGMDYHGYLRHLAGIFAV